MFAFLNTLFGRRRSLASRARTCRSSVRKPAQPRRLEVEDLEQRLVLSTIGDKYLSLGGPSGFLGQPTTPESVTRDGIGRYEYFQHGTIYWSPATGAHEVHGAIRAKYDATAALTDAYGRRVLDILGLPTSDELPAANNGRVSHFQGGDVYANLGVGAYVVYGAIRAKYDATAALTDAYGRRVLDILGLPTSDELPAANNGRVSHFQGGDVYANLGVGTYVVYGAIKVKYNALGGPGGQAGLPTSDELAVPGGRVSRFQGADIYALPGVGVHEVHGAIRAEYNALGGASSVLGLPTSDETDTYRHDGRFNTFQHGTIFWSSATGAHEVDGAILNLYASMGWEMSALGFPTSDVQAVPTGQVSYFQNGKIVSTPQDGAYAVQAVSTMTFNSNVNFSGGTPVGGWASLTVYMDGTYHFVGHLHDSGAPSYNDNVMFALVSPSGQMWAAVHPGHMAGTFESGSRDDNWDVTSTDPRLAANWADFLGSHYYVTTNVNADWNPLVNQVEQAAGIALAVVGIVYTGGGAVVAAPAAG